MPNLPAFALNDLVASAGTFYSTSGLQVPLNFVTAPGNVQQAAPVESPVADLVEALINNGAESKLILAEFATSSNSDTSQPDPESPWDKVKNSLPTLDVAQAWKDLIAFLKKLGGERAYFAVFAPGVLLHRIAEKIINGSVIFTPNSRFALNCSQRWKLP